MIVTSHTTDYNLPLEWDGMSDEERNRWLTQERCRRLNGRMETQLQREMDKTRKRETRKRKADPGMVDLKEYR